ncbi:MAG TPA: hypothetical protein VJ043_03525 [Candidatus Paceibacterota bacterium]|nr:MAG: hypothetical protein UX54_C0018G0011 [Parcubacteria group bacterium GW2011_GWA2_46_39]HXK39131.1 hypothetical protein [Candidatus Paceibacterota bacterium]
MKKTPKLRTTNYELRTNRGFTLLLAALVASITLAIGVSIFEITQKQVILSSLGRDSQFAFYTADTGAECALYYDVRHGYFGTSTPPADAVCDSQTLSMSGRAPSLPYTISFQFEPGGLCAQVSVEKSSSNPQTVIHADGYSTNCASITTNPRALQRSVEIKY